MKALSFVAVLCTAPALATPGEMVTLTDRLVATSATSVFVLREAEHNLGSHFASLTDTFLIEWDAASGAKREMWHVGRVRVSHGEEGTVDRVALPSAEGGQATALFEARGGTLVPGPSLPATDALFVIHAAQVQGIIEDIAETALGIPVYPPEALADLPRVFFSAREMLSAPDYATDDCAITEAGAFPLGGAKEVRLARIDCDADADPVSLIVVVPDP